MKTTIENRTDKAAKLMMKVDSTYLLEEFAMCHLDDFACRLKMEYVRKVKAAGLEGVDYFALALRFTLAFIERFENRHQWKPEGKRGESSKEPVARSHSFKGAMQRLNEFLPLLKSINGSEEILPSDFSAACSMSSATGPTDTNPESSNEEPDPTSS